jgi:hypothetical protein
MTKKADQKKSAEQLRLEREKRVTDTIQMKIPDRVPIICGMGYFPAKAAGIPFSAAYYDFKAWYNAYKKVLPDYPRISFFPRVSRRARHWKFWNRSLPAGQVLMPAPTTVIRQ